LLIVIKNDSYEFRARDFYLWLFNTYLELVFI